MYARAIRAALLDFYRKSAVRYADEPHAPTLEKALAYAGAKDKAEILFDLGRYAEAEEAFAAPARKGECAFRRGDWAKAAEHFAAVI